MQVGHACKVGEDTLLCGQVGLAGTTVVGNRCILAGQVGAAGHLDNRRRRDALGAERRADRRARRRDLFGLSGDGQSRLAEIGGGFQSPAGIAEGSARICARKIARLKERRWRATVSIENDDMDGSSRGAPKTPHPPRVCAREPAALCAGSPRAPRSAVRRIRRLRPCAARARRRR